MTVIEVIEAEEMVCCVGRQLVRTDIPLPLNLDDTLNWTDPCPHEVVRALIVNDEESLQYRLFLCHCHEQGMDGIGALSRSSRL